MGKLSAKEIRPRVNIQSALLGETRIPEDHPGTDVGGNRDQERTLQKLQGQEFS